jgi:hypothetical protein
MSAQGHIANAATAPDSMSQMQMLRSALPNVMPEIIYK